MDRKAHWENIYSTKASDEVSWYQETPALLEWIDALNLDRHATILDIGGGDSTLVDHLLLRNFSNLTVLDISEQAIDRARKRVGKDASRVHWVVSDVLSYELTNQADLWHDRAVFHFLTGADDIHRYVNKTREMVKPGGYLLIATFSDQGPLKCSGIEITQYSVAQLEQTFSPHFVLERSANVDHHTPFGTIQNFSVCLFRRLSE